jgi:hypothetical protein
VDYFSYIFVREHAGHKRYFVVVIRGFDLVKWTEKVFHSHVWNKKSVPMSCMEQQSVSVLFVFNVSSIVFLYFLVAVDTHNGIPFIDYSDKRSLPLTIPEYRVVEKSGEKYVVFNIHMAGRYLCSRRYSDFVKLETHLKKEFLGFSFPRLPGKWPFV